MLAWWCINGLLNRDWCWSDHLFHMHFFNYIISVGFPINYLRKSNFPTDYSSQHVMNVSDIKKPYWWKLSTLDIIWTQIQVLQITDIRFDQLVINNEKIFITSCHFYWWVCLKFVKGCLHMLEQTWLVWGELFFVEPGKKEFHLFLGEIIFILFCEKDLDLDEFEKRESCCLLVTLCKLVVPLHMDFANR